MSVWTAATVQAQAEDIPIRVNGTTLVTQRAATRVGKEWFVPLLPIARALGIRMERPAGNETIVARHPDGFEYTYNIRTGEIRNQFLRIGRVSNPEQVSITTFNDDFLFPLNGAVALLGFTVEEDEDQNVLMIRSIPGSTPGGGLGAGVFDIANLNYTFGFATTGKQSSQIASINGEGVLGGMRLTGNLQMSRVPRSSLMGFRNGSLRAEFGRNRALLFGDQSTYAGIDAMTMSVRGLGYEGKVRGFNSYFYAGRGVGAKSTEAGSIGIARYDTNIAGFSLRRRHARTEFSISGNSFAGPSRKGSTLGVAMSSFSLRNQFRVQGLAGDFLKGPAAGFAIADTFTPISGLSITGQTEYYGRHFLTARDDSHFNGQSNSSVNVAIRPLSFLNVTGGVSNRHIVGSPGHALGHNYGVQASTGGKTPVLFGYFTSTNTDPSSDRGLLQLTQYSITLPALKNFSSATYYSVFRHGNEIVKNVNTFGSFNTRHGQLGFRDQLQFGSTHRYGVEWLRNLASPDSYIRIGLDRVQAVQGRAAIAPTASVRLPFFGGQRIQLTYTGDRNSHLFQIELSGPVMRSRHIERDDTGELALVRSSNIDGRVYHDVNGNGRFDENEDKPIRDLVLWVDDTFKAVTDGSGKFRFSKVDPGAHLIRADLSGIPADLVLADKSERTVAVVPNGQNVQDFRVLKTGSIRGKVTVMDYSADPKNPVERSYPDARITVGPSLDTYSETNGNFHAGDLAPGTYELQVDGSTIPDGYASEPVSLKVSVNPGQINDSPQFRLVVPPRPVIQRKLAPQAMGSASSAAASQSH